MACCQQVVLGASSGIVLGGWGRHGGAGILERMHTAEGMGARAAPGNGTCSVPSSPCAKQRKHQLTGPGASYRSAFLGADFPGRWHRSASVPPAAFLGRPEFHASASVISPVEKCRSFRTHTRNGFGCSARQPQRSRLVSARAEEQSSERPAGDGASSSTTAQDEPPQTSDSARGGDPNEPEERYGKGGYPNPYPILPRKLQRWQLPKREVIPGYEIHYHEDGRRFTEEEEEEYELQRKVKVVDAAFEEYERQCAEAFARGDFAPIPPPRLARLPAKDSNLVQTAQDGLELMVPDANVYDPGITLDEALENMRAAVGYHDYYSLGMVTVKGEGHNVPGAQDLQRISIIGKGYKVLELLNKVFFSKKGLQASECRKLVFSICFKMVVMRRRKSACV